MSKTKLLKIKMGETKINGLVCSPNNFEFDIAPTSIPLTCDSVVIGNDQLLGPFYTNVKVSCPK